MTHTLWPWEVHHFLHRDGGQVAIFHKPGKKTVEIFRIHFPPGIGQKAREISRLIEAAPDLLSALEELSNFWAYGLAKDDAVEDSAKQRKRDLRRCEELGWKARAAVDKAKGKDGAE